jgi:hypothetical protein
VKKNELNKASDMLRTIKADVILRGMPYARVRKLDDALAVIDQLLLEGSKAKS